MIPERTTFGTRLREQDRSGLSTWQINLFLQIPRICGDSEVPAEQNPTVRIFAPLAQNPKVELSPLGINYEV